MGGEENGGGGWGWVGQRVSAVRKSVFSRKVLRDVGESAVRSLPAVLLGMLLNILDGVSCEYQNTHDLFFTTLSLFLFSFFNFFFFNSKK